MLALVARVEELEAENRLFKMELTQLTQTTQAIMKSLGDVNDELQEHKKRSMQSVQDYYTLMQDQCALVQKQANIGQRHNNQVNLDVSDLKKRMRDVDGRIATLENANELYGSS